MDVLRVFQESSFFQGRLFQECWVFQGILRGDSSEFQGYKKSSKVVTRVSQRVSKGRFKAFLKKF